MRPKDRFKKKVRKRYKALRKAVRNILPPEGHAFIPGLTYGCKYPYVEVYRLPNTPVGKVYFDGDLTKKFVKRELKEFMEEM